VAATLNHNLKPKSYFEFYQPKRSIEAFGASTMPAGSNPPLDPAFCPNG